MVVVVLGVMLLVVQLLQGLVNGSRRHTRREIALGGHLQDHLGSYVVRVERGLVCGVVRSPSASSHSIRGGTAGVVAATVAAAMVVVAIGISYPGKPDGVVHIRTPEAMLEPESVVAADEQEPLADQLQLRQVLRRQCYDTV